MTDEEKFTITDFKNKKSEFLTDEKSLPYGHQYLKMKLLEHYGESILYNGR